MRYPNFSALFAWLLLPAIVQAADIPRVIDVTPQQFVGERICVCGNFPTPESQQSITIDGKPVGAPEAAFANVVVIRIPADLSPGLHTIGGLYAAGFPASDQVKFLALKLNAQIDKSVLRRGESTKIRMILEGTTKKINLDLTNQTPAIAALEGGVRQIVQTSGGNPNQAQRTVTGSQPYQFRIDYQLPDAICPCKPAAAPPSDIPRDLPEDTPDTPGDLPKTPGEVPTTTPCDVLDVKGAMELSQGAWQDDPFFKQFNKPKAGNKLEKISDRAYKANLAMVRDRPTLIFGIGDSDFNEIVIEAVTTGKQPVDVEVLFTLYEGSRKIQSVYRTPEKRQLYLYGPCGDQKKFQFPINTDKGLPPPPDTSFGMLASDSYRMEAELVLAGTDTGTGIKIEVSGPVVDTRLPKLYFNPLMLSDSALGKSDGLKSVAQKLVSQSEEILDDYYPVEPDTIRAEAAEPENLVNKLKKFTIPDEVRKLKRSGEREKAIELLDQVDQERTKEWRSSVVVDQMLTRRLLANEGIFIAILSQEDYEDFAPLGSGGATISTKLILTPDSTNIDVIAHEVIHSRHRGHLFNGWGGEEMDAECGLDYHGFFDKNYAYGFRIYKGIEEVRDKVIRRKSIMADADDPNIARWINQCSYMHLLQELQGKGDPPVILVRGVAARDGEEAGVFFPFYQTGGEIDPEDPQGRWSVVLRDATGKELDRHRFEPVWKWPHTNKDRSIVPFSMRLEDRPGVAAVELEGPNGVLIKRQYSAHAPEIEVIHPKHGSIFADHRNKIHVKWKGKDADGDPLLYSVFYSSDNGEHWVDVVFEQQETEAEIAISAKSEKHAIKILASDGARSSEKILPISTQSSGDDSAEQ